MLPPPGTATYTAQRSLRSSSLYARAAHGPRPSVPRAHARSMMPVYHSPNVAVPTSPRCHVSGESRVWNYCSDLLVTSSVAAGAAYGCFQGSNQPYTVCAACQSKSQISRRSSCKRAGYRRWRREVPKSPTRTVHVYVCSKEYGTIPIQIQVSDCDTSTVSQGRVV